MFLDNPISDDLEEKAIEFLVECGWDKFSTFSTKTRYKSYTRST